MAELRKYERVGFLCRIELTVLPEGVPQAARSIDLSLGGVGVITQAAFSVGQMVAATFFLTGPDDGEAKVRVIGRVARLAADVDANVLGVQFLSPLTEAEFPRLVDKLLSL
jgi:hypothetical protein